MWSTSLRARTDSQLFTIQITEEYQTKDPQLSKYLTKVLELAKGFKFFKAIYVPIEKNSKADLLAKLVSTKKPSKNRTIIQETISSPSTYAILMATVEDQKDGWMDRYFKYLIGAFRPLVKKKSP